MSCRPVCIPLPTKSTDTGFYCPTCSQVFLTPPWDRAQFNAMAPVRGNRTFKVKFLLKQLGGRWDPTGKTWWVPLPRLNEALNLTQHGNDPDGSEEDSGPSVDTWLCWECGDHLPPSDVVMIRSLLTRPDSGETTDLYWCGCNDND